MKHLIGTEKRKQNTFERVYDWQFENQKKFWHIWHLVTIREFSSM